ncbi:MAG TPA: HlyD family efflux transporter periplasmic adaptor subunit [Longimicrobiales bacterium]|nr:HlyD family efflux transporter periplasmic adaptor subunit [Longimicrobiales bacterium]
MKRRIPIAVAVVLLLGLAAWLLFGRSASASDTLEASGTVEATTADLGFQAPGRIAEVNAEEGARVGAGALLAKLDVAELDARRAAAVAQLETARAQLAELERGARPEELAQARAAVAAADQKLEEARRDFERTRRLEAGGAVSREALERVETAHVVARSQASQAREQLQLVQSGPRSERIDAARAQVAAAQAAVAQVDATLSNAKIVAPFAGVVTERHREPGETVGAGQPVVTLMNPADRWVRIYVREDRVGRVSLGQPARITTDSHPDSEFTGRVVHIASEAEFTPRNVQTEEERVKLVYALKVQIAGDDALALKPGVPADVVLVSDARQQD